MGFDFSGKTAIVTGGANGIGYACARALAAGGANLWIFDLEREDPEKAAAAIGGRGAVADVTRRESIEAALDLSGTPDIVVANAGTVVFEEIGNTTRAHWDRVIGVNLTGMFETVQAAAARMKKRRQGSIVLTASTNSYDGEASLIAYNASKAGVLGILHTAANELGPFGVRVNAVCPGLIRTRLTSAAFDDEAVIKEYFRAIPLGRGGEPEEVANAVAFFASGLSSFVTGATLLVDGGQMACKFGTWNDRDASFEKDHWKLK